MEYLFLWFVLLFVLISSVVIGVVSTDEKNMKRYVVIDSRPANYYVSPNILPPK